MSGEPGTLRPGTSRPDTPRPGGRTVGDIAAAACDERTAQALRRFHDVRVAEWAPCVEQAVARGELPHGTDPATVAAAAAGAYGDGPGPGPGPGLRKGHPPAPAPPAPHPRTPHTGA